MTEGLSVNVKLTGRIVYVFGGGAVAARKIPQFLKSDATVYVVAPMVCDSVKRLVKKQVVHWISQAAETFLNAPDASWHHCFLLVMATDDYLVHDLIREHATHIPLQLDAVRAENGNISLPANWSMDGLNVSFSTSGISPGLAKMIREQWSNWFDEQYADRFSGYAQMIECFRKQFKLHVEDTQLRQQLNRQTTDLDYFQELHQTFIQLVDWENKLVEYTWFVLNQMGIQIQLEQMEIEKEKGQQNVLSSTDGLVVGEEIESHASNQSGHEGQFVGSHANGANH